MNKKFWTGFVAVYVTIAVVEFIVNMVLMSAAYMETANLWRPMAEMKIWLFYVIYLFVAFFVTLLFSKGYEGKGVLEGVRFGFYIGMFMAVPMAYGTYASMPIPYSFALQWFIYGLIEYIIVGVVLALVYGKQAMVTPVPKT